MTEQQAPLSDDGLAAYAADVLKPRRLSDEASAGGVAAAIFALGGNVYRGVCIDTTSGMGFCAEHSAAAAMVTAGESRIERVVAVSMDERGRVRRVPPCGRCREFLRQLDERNLEAAVLLEGGRVTLDALLPYIPTGRQRTLPTPAESSQRNNVARTKRSSTLLGTFPQACASEPPPFRERAGPPTKGSNRYLIVSVLPSSRWTVREPMAELSPS